MTPPPMHSAPIPNGERPNGGVPTLALAEDELRDLVELITLRQEAAPAKINVEDLRGQKTVEIQISHSAAFESLVLGSLGRSADERRVIAFTASASVETEFHPNFFVTQHGKTYRPNPEDTREVAYLVGEAGPIPEGALALGYFVIPGHFRPGEPMVIWWNDRSIDAVLAP